MAEMNARVCQIGQACGIDFQFDRIERLPNTTLSHQLIQITPHNVQTDMSDAVTRAHFEEGRDIGQLSVLLDVAEEVGLNREDTEQKLRAGAGSDQVEADLRFAKEAGISGVPFFVFNDRYALSGAQPVEVFVQTLQKISSEI